MIIQLTTYYGSALVPCRFLNRGVLDCRCRLFSWHVRTCSQFTTLGVIYAHKKFDFPMILWPLRGQHWSNPILKTWQPGYNPGAKSAAFNLFDMYKLFEQYAVRKQNAKSAVQGSSSMISVHACSCAAASTSLRALQRPAGLYNYVWIISVSLFGIIAHADLVSTVPHDQSSQGYTPKGSRDSAFGRHRTPSSEAWQRANGYSPFSSANATPIAMWPDFDTPDERSQHKQAGHIGAHSPCAVQAARACDNP